MAKITILIDGYVRKDEEVLYAVPTTVFIRDNGIGVLVDPGSRKDLLIYALEQYDINPEDINYIFLTHFHLDHILNMNLFPHLPICDGEWITFGERMEKHKDIIPDTSIKIVLTPGHTPEHASLIVETEEGRIGIAGDLFWWFNTMNLNISMERLITLSDPFAYDKNLLIQSRKKLIQKVDFIIPGHGTIFKTK